jgi:hypothetical protein
MKEFREVLIGEVRSAVGSTINFLHDAQYLASFQLNDVM